MRLSAALVLGALFSLSAAASIELPAIVSDDMVLQTNLQVGRGAAAAARNVCVCVCVCVCMCVRARRKSKRCDGEREEERDALQKREKHGKRLCVCVCTCMYVCGYVCGGE